MNAMRNLRDGMAQLVRGWRLLALVAVMACACQPGRATAPPPTSGATELTFYYWEGYIDQAILDEFTRETRIVVHPEYYTSYEEAIAHIRAGEVYDVVILGTEDLPGLIADGLIAAIDYRAVPNFKNITPNFRDLAYDPGNTYSIPMYWGTTGLVMRTDSGLPPVRRWADLWKPVYAKHVALWGLPRDVVGMALKSLGYSLNSESPVELQAAEDKLMQLRPNVIIVDPNAPTFAPLLREGKAQIGYGWSYDYRVAANDGLPVEYVLPEEGTIIWGENIFIPIHSPNKAAAEQFINFLLRGEISARSMMTSYTAMPNDAALEFIDPQLLQDPSIFPPADALTNAEFILPVSAETERRMQAIAARFVQGPIVHSGP
jgi:spermidine/putrescine transport system substrate-binding protein